MLKEILIYVTTSLEILFLLLLNILELKEDGYTDLIINRIIFTYAIFEGKTQVN